MSKFLTISLFLFLVIFRPNIASSLTSSSYLIANSAISYFDYETAAKYFNNDDYSDFSIKEFRKKIIIFINTNKLEEAKLLTKQAIKLDNSNEDFWLVLLAIAKLTNDLKFFSDFEKLSNKDEFEIINYVFYENGLLRQNNEELAEQLFDLVRATDS